MLDVSQFIVSFENANIKKGVKIRKGYAKISRSIEMSVLSTDAFKLYTKLCSLSEKVKVSDLYLREFIRNERNEKLSRQRLTRAKNQLIEYSLLAIKQSNHHRFNYEWLLYDENGKKLKHFNLGKFENKSIFEKAVEKELKTELKNKAHFENESSKIDTSSAVTFDTATKKSLYIETRANKLNKYINIKIFKNLKIINLKIKRNLKLKKEVKKVMSPEANLAPDFAKDFLKINDEELKQMAKKKFTEPSIEEIQEVIKAFNKEHNCGLNVKTLAMRFVNYYKREDGVWRMSNNKPLRDWKRALINTWLMRELESWQRLSEWAKKRDLQRLENEERMDLVEHKLQRSEEDINHSIAREIKAMQNSPYWDLVKNNYSLYLSMPEIQRILRADECVNVELIECKGV